VDRPVVVDQQTTRYSRSVDSPGESSLRIVSISPSVSANSAYSVSRPGSRNSIAADLSQTVKSSPSVRRSIVM